MERTQVAALIMSSQPALGNKQQPTPASPLAPIAGKSVLSWVVDAALGASIRRIGVVANDVDVETRSELAARSDRAMIEFIARQRDLADTVSYALERIGSAITLHEGSHVLVLPAEAPQLESIELRNLVQTHVEGGAAASLLTGALDPSAPLDGDPTVSLDRDAGDLTISDAAADLTGVLCINASMLVPVLRRVHAPSWRRTLPLGEVARVLHEIGHEVDVITRTEPIELITSAVKRTTIEMMLHDRVIAAWRDRGTSMPDPRQVTIDATVTLGQGVQVLPGSVLEGASVVGDGAVIGPNTHLVNAHVGTAAVVPHSVVRNAEVRANEQLEPFSVLGAASA